jgi:hypothetical protein
MWGWIIAGIAWLALSALAIGFAWCCCKVADRIDVWARG